MHGVPPLPIAIQVTTHGHAHGTMPSFAMLPFRTSPAPPRSSIRARPGGSVDAARRTGAGIASDLDHAGFGLCRAGTCDGRHRFVPGRPLFVPQPQAEFRESAADRRSQTGDRTPQVVPARPLPDPRSGGAAARGRGRQGGHIRLAQGGSASGRFDELQPHLHDPLSTGRSASILDHRPTIRR